ncbi:MAG: ABC transporter substrate-binding protein [Candidatus Thorarchaeota archaeon]
MRKDKILLSISILMVICLSSVNFFNFSNTKAEEETTIYFTLVAKTNYGGVRPDYLYILQDQLLEIGINLTVIELDWITFLTDMMTTRDFDICYTDMTGNEKNLDYTTVYSENGNLNVFGYDTSLDWNETFGTGKNEWYIKMGNIIMPPDSIERVHHYWAWEQYMMDKILPCQPAFVTKSYSAYWNELVGYNFTEDILQSWGKMYWSNLHYNQSSMNELRVYSYISDGLNPATNIFYYPTLVTTAVMDSLIWFDCDRTAWPHLAESYFMINDTYLRINTRDGVKWQEDPDGLFPNEYFDAYDVYFSLDTYKNGTDFAQNLDWIKEMKIVDSNTIDIFIDSDPFTQYSQSESNCLVNLVVPMLPEHYLNQTQISDGKSPDRTHISWEKFDNCSFGTGLFKVNEFIPNNYTKLELFSDSWWLDESLTNSPGLSWDNRFGAFSSPIQNLTIYKATIDTDVKKTFESGYIDILGLAYDVEDKNFYSTHPWFSTQETLITNLGFFAYNLRQSRSIIGNRNPCPGDPSMSIGLAVRKAISYAMDRDVMNLEVNNNEKYKTDWPIFRTQGIWCSPNIIRYNHNLDLAKYYMSIAGYPLIISPTTTPSTTLQFGIPLVATNLVLITSLTIICLFKKKGK